MIEIIEALKSNPCVFYVYIRAVVAEHSII